MNNYKQLTEGQRYQIAALKKVAESNKEIAMLVDNARRELRRNRGKQGYRPQQAHNTACQRKRVATKAIKMTDEVIGLEMNRFVLIGVQSRCQAG